MKSYPSKYRKSEMNHSSWLLKMVFSNEAMTG